MALFQKSILKKYIAMIDEKVISEKWEMYQKHFLDYNIQENIRNSKEEQYQEGFLRDLFVNILGYTLNPTANFNLTTEYKNIKDSKKADGAIIIDGKVLGVIELKGTNTTDLGKIEAQAFGYKNNQTDCIYVVSSNFEKLRFYINNAINFLEFNLFLLNYEDFKLLYLCLSLDSIKKNLPKKLKQESISAEENITKQLYKDYSQFKRELFANLCDLNPDIEPLVLFKKSQKLLDRFLFLLFAEDCHLLPTNSVRKILADWEKLKELDAYTPLYERFKQYFGYLNLGNAERDIFAYNGGLFRPDEILDNAKISDDILYRNTKKLSDYDFNSEVDVNILGHIFENSLNETDEIQAQIQDESIEKSQTKRKKDGVFYTPKYITKYIVENSIGKLCTDKKQNLSIVEEDFYKKQSKKNKEILLQKLNEYRDWLLQLSIIDPACGSGAFLNEALNFLIAEHQLLDELESKLFGSSITFPNIENSILENNLFGVDINEESVEIAKLSLWLRTAQRGRKLNDLSHNIKSGNSLIAETTIAGEKAFAWEKEFPQIFKEKDKKAFHITTAIHDSRTSQRMIDYKVREYRYMGTQPKAQVVPFTKEEEIIVSRTIAEITQEKNLKILAYNICIDHIHILLVCEEEEINKIVQGIKGRTAFYVNQHRNKHIQKQGAKAALPNNTTQQCGFNPLSKQGDFSPLSENSIKQETKASFPNNATQQCGFSPLSENSIKQETEASLPNNSNKGLKSLATKSSTKNKPIWTQKFGCVEITNEEQLFNTINYIENNRTKHEIEDTPIFRKELNNIINHIVCSYDQAFAPEYKGGFDVVIGNPPYVSTKQIIKKQKDFFSQKYNTAIGQYDLYILFYEKGLSITKKEGILSYITSNTFISNKDYHSFRKFILENYNILEIINLGETVFEDANLDVAILSFKNTNNNNPKIKIIRNRKDFDLENAFFVSQNDFIQDNFEMKINICDEDRNILTKLYQNSILLNDILDLPRGIEFGSNSEKIFHEKKQGAYKIIFGKNIDQYSIHFDNNYCFFENNISVFKSFDIYANEKILIQRIRNLSLKKRIIATYDNENYLCTNTLRIGILKNKNYNLLYILSILNSALINFLFLKQFLNKDIYAFQLQQIPIKEIPLSEQQPFIEKAEQMLSLNQELQDKKQKFLRRLGDNFGIEKFSKKLETFWEMAFSDLVKELKKQKITLSLKEQDDWENYFLAYQKEILGITAQITTTDQEINTMVYQLYGLTEEEIKIIDNA